MKQNAFRTKVSHDYFYTITAASFSERDEGSTYFSRNFNYLLSRFCVISRRLAINE